MDFSEGGLWLYAMTGPDGTRSWCRVDFKTIVPHKSFTYVTAFCDENGIETAAFPAMNWTNEFSPADPGTEVSIVISFSSEADMQQITEMGFREGFTAAHVNLDEYLSKQ
jgi:uncharacterized protein YndB with AHSA1/START domain